MADEGFEARSRVIEGVIEGATGDPGTMAQVEAGLRELADLESGDCLHPLGHITPDECVTCQARRFLRLLESKRPLEDLPERS